MHIPLTHVIGLTQTANPPHVQTPDPLHPSATSPHVWHPIPPVPHALGLFPGAHCVGSVVQQPMHDVSSQTHAPPEQYVPLVHAVPPPQVHCPERLHPSPVVPHPPHACPMIPHSFGFPVAAHVPASVQQLPAHDVLVHWHAPFEHTCPVAHWSD
jgi:hypothetical protein